MTDNAWAYRWSLRVVIAALRARQVFGPYGKCSMSTDTEMFGLDGKVAVVIGGGRGIGKMIVAEATQRRACLPQTARRFRYVVDSMMAWMPRPKTEMTAVRS
jgi:hypothetical protein